MTIKTTGTRLSARLRIFASLLLLLCASAAMAEKPNILIIFTDDKCELPGEVGHKDAKNTNILTSSPHVQIT